jgi:hypothetical protein
MEEKEVEMKNYTVHEIITTCYTYHVCARNEDEATEKIKYNNGDGHIPEYDMIIDIKYSAEEAFVFPNQLQEFQNPYSPISRFKIEILE